ncbi:MAG TPA: YqgE/AlgH family protein [Acidimicrobiales bacterium]|nr:YqgE/AlgH family protein [Acidimicrobiales bacterium]
MSEGSFTGRLLVAAPALRDPNFDRTVVLVLEHGPEGAVGVVLNRPTGTDLYAALPRWEGLAADPSVVFEGGPVAPTAAICIARTPVVAEDEPEGWRPLFAGLGTVDLGRDPEELSQPVRDIRVFAGYAGWGADQLEGEVASGAWYVLDALPDDALSADPDDLWRTVLRRQRGKLAMVANFPTDPVMN